MSIKQEMINKQINEYVLNNEQIELMEVLNKFSFTNNELNLADPNPLMLAIENKNFGVIEILIAAGSDINQLDKSGNPLSFSLLASLNSNFASGANAFERSRANNLLVKLQDRIEFDKPGEYGLNALQYLVSKEALSSLNRVLAPLVFESSKQMQEQRLSAQESTLGKLINQKDNDGQMFLHTAAQFIGDKQLEGFHKTLINIKGFLPNQASDYEDFNNQVPSDLTRLKEFKGLLAHHQEQAQTDSIRNQIPEVPEVSAALKVLNKQARMDQGLVEVPSMKKSNTL